MCAKVYEGLAFFIPLLYTSNYWGSLKLYNLCC